MAENNNGDSLQWGARFEKILRERYNFTISDLTPKDRLAVIGFMEQRHEEGRSPDEAVADLTRKLGESL